MRPTTERRPPTTTAERAAAEAKRAALFDEHGLPIGIETMSAAELAELRATVLQEAEALYDAAQEEKETQIEHTNTPAGLALTSEQLAEAAERLAQARAENPDLSITVCRPTVVPATIPHHMPAVRQPALPTIVTPAITEIEGFEGYTPEHLLVPRLKIVQPQTHGIADMGSLGQYTNTLTGEITPTPTLVFLRFQDTRAKFEKGNFTPTALECASNDGKRPNPGVRHAFANTCAECPMAKWAGDGKRPPCNQGLTFLALDVANDNAPLMFTCAGTALKEGRRLVTQLGFRKKPLYSYLIQASTILVTADKGKWYLPILRADPIIDDDLIANYRSMYLALRSMQIAADTEAFAEDEAAQ